MSEAKPTHPASNKNLELLRQEDLPDELVRSIRDAAHGLIKASWSCDAVAPTISEFVRDLQSGHSTYDMSDFDVLRVAALAAGELVGLSRALGRSVPELLGVVWIRDELWCNPEASQ